MREIKFRGWSSKQHKFYMFPGIFNKKPYIEHSTFVQYESYPEYLDLEIEQYTGLKDKNGREIYEGDILRFKEDISGVMVCRVVYYDEELLEFGLKLTWQVFNAQFGNEFEYVGNIHENPELTSEPS